MSDTSFPVGLLMTVLALALVLVLAWFAIRMLSRLGQSSLGRSGRLRVIESIAIGQRERIMLVKLDERELLIGVSAGGVSRLHDAGETPDSGNPPVGTPAGMRPEDRHAKLITSAGNRDGRTS